jgi:hypothetical protein
MGFDWGDDTYKYKVSTIPLAGGRYRWRLTTIDTRAAERLESCEDSEQIFDTQAAAEEAGNERMVELLRGVPPKPR